MSPEQQAEMQRLQQQQPPAGDPAPAPQVDPAAAPAAPVEAPVAPAIQEEPTPEQLQAAKEVLGIDQIEAQLQQSKENGIREELSKKYPNVPADKVAEEIARIEKTDPALAQAMKNNPVGLDHVYAALNATIAPPADPDDITNSADNGGNLHNPETMEKLNKGEKVSDTELGDFILENS